jgi:type I restriction enzyme, R subunit
MNAAKVSLMSEDELELLALEWFQEQGYHTVYGPDIESEGKSPERIDTHQIILRGRLLNALHKINPKVPTKVLEGVVDQLEKSSKADMIQANKSFHELLLDGVPVEYIMDGNRRGDRVKLIDFSNPLQNEYLAVNQFTVKGTKGHRRPDIVIFVNGLPVCVIELKKPTDEKADIWKAYDQLQTYKDEISDLFVCNEILVISDGFNARLGSLTASEEWFMRWRAIKNEKDKPLVEFELETMIRGFFDREMLLDFLRYFILFEENGGSIIKKIAGYHQFHAVRSAVQSVVRASQPDGDRKGGVVWHTQGSGKSISMACFTGKLLQQESMQNPTIVVVTDRNDLDGQLFETFSFSKMLLKQTPVQAESRDTLRDLLQDRPSGGIIFTTIQKFAPEKGDNRFQQLSERTNIVVIADEAHRSQYGFNAVLQKNSDEYKYGYAQHMRDGLPNATFIGFTGTPISLVEKDTQAVFGGYVSIYDIQDAVEDEATVKIYYESRLAKINLDEAAIPHLDDDVEDVIEDDEDQESKERTKSKWAALEKLVGAQPRMDQVAEDIVSHYETRTQSVEGKALVVCMSREICVQMYDALTKLRPGWHSEDPELGAIKVVMTGSASDKQHLQPHIYNGRTKKRLEKRFKDAKDDLNVVIVRDMWLTGFDAPICHTMYIDKPMRGHNLMQAIARVNRVLKGKDGGVVVDYIGIADELKKAMRIYAGAKGKGKQTVNTAEALAKLMEILDVARNLFSGFDYSRFKVNPNRLLVPAANHILGLEDGKKRFADTVLGMTKAFSLCSTLDDAKVFREEIAFFQAVKAVIVKFTAKPPVSEERKDSLLKQILDNAVVAEGVDDIFALAGIEKPDLSILSDEFLAEVKRMPYKNLALELLHKLLNDEFNSRLKTNVVLGKKYSELLKNSINRLIAKGVESAHVIEELIEIAKAFRAAAEKGEKMGLSPDEVAFYDALANNESAIKELGDEKLMEIAHVLVEKLRKSTTVDWQVRESVRAKLRNLVRVTLKRYKYPPDMQKEAVELVLEQATVLADSWSDVA